LDTVGLEGLPVDVNETVVLALSTLAFSVISQPGTGVVKGVDKHKGERTSETTRKDVLGELLNLAGILAVLNIPLMVSLKAKFKAWVGKYLSTLAKLPLQKGMTPSFLRVLPTQSMTPL